MKKTFLLIALFLTSATLFAQSFFSKPDYYVIKERTKDKSAEMYYPKLLERYNNNDTTLDIKEYRMLYYGRFFNKNVGKPLVSQFSKASEERREYMSKDSLTEEDYRAIVKLSDKILKEYPFNLRTLYSTFRVHMELGDTAAAEPYLQKTRNIVSTILSTGDGLSEETAFHVLEISDEYFVLNAIGYTSTGKQNLTLSKCDRLEVEENDNNVEALYFDVKQIFEGYKEMFKDNPPILPKLEKKRKKDKK